MRVVSSISVILLLVNGGVGLDNGLGLTPPMGWLTWERFKCIVDCDTRPDECISERLVKITADLMVSEGYLAAGYEYLGIDDCWLAKERDAQGKLVPDKKRFPNGMKAVGDYLHSLGMKFGLYEDYGTNTCAGYPGILGNLETDANTFAEWGVDYVKLDGCYVDSDKMDEGYPEFGRYLNKTGRPMLYSCSWPAYQNETSVNWTKLVESCNLWRNWDDVQDSWQSLSSISQYFGKHSHTLAGYAGPGHWNDPDMLLIGNFGLSFDQSKVQMAIWAILAAPLLMSTDLKNVKPEMKEILLNKEVIAVNQDALGKAGILHSKDNNFEVWRREVMPIVQGDASVVIAVVNLSDDGAPHSITLNISDLGIPKAKKYIIKNLFETSANDYVLADVHNITMLVNPTGVQMIKIEVIE